MPAILMANTGFDWGSWSVLTNAVVLTTGGTILNTSAAVALDLKAACEISIDAAFSNHARATGGLNVSALRDIDGTNYEDGNSGALKFEQPFVQATTVKKSFSISPGDFGSFKIRLDWLNTTASSNVTVTVRYRLADIPAAS
jgi:hypothetical protein